MVFLLFGTEGGGSRLFDFFDTLVDSRFNGCFVVLEAHKKGVEKFEAMDETEDMTAEEPDFEEVSVEVEVVVDLWLLLPPDVADELPEDVGELVVSLLSFSFEEPVFNGCEKR